MAKTKKEYSIEKRGESFRVIVCNGYTPEGKKILIRKTYSPKAGLSPTQTQKELNAFALALLKEVKSGKNFDFETMPFKEFADKWLEEIQKAKVTEQTLQNYKDLLRLHVTTYIGYFKIKALNVAVFHNLLNRLRSGDARKDRQTKSLSPQTIRKVFVVVNMVMQQAIKWQVILDNPVNRVDLPKHKRKQTKNFFDIEQTKLFLKALEKPFIVTMKTHERTNGNDRNFTIREYTQEKKVSVQLKSFFYLAVFAGLRRGEVISLQWHRMWTLKMALLKSVNPHQ